MAKVPKAGKGVAGAVAKPAKAPKAPRAIAVPGPATPSPPAPAPAPAPAPSERTIDGGPLRRLIDAATGARLCYGEPVPAGERTVIPVARISAVGGWGFGRGGGGTDGGEGLGHGGGGTLEARPIGFIEVGPDGSRYVPIPDPDQLGRTLRAAATALVTVSGAAALGRRRGTAGLLPRRTRS